MTRSPSTEPRLADVRVITPISIVVPTFRERENLPELVAGLDELRARYGLTLELLIMDDDSRDGSEAWVQEHAPDWVRLVVRRETRGLSPAVVDGLRLAKHPVLVVMDADLSHPPSAIPAMILALESGQDFVIGSRYVRGGSTDDDWGFFRWLNSRVATLLARPFTDAKDPMAGFFALRRTDFDRAFSLDPIGYKVGLELIVKCRLGNVGEVPIHFSDRIHGESKLTFKEQLNYLRHLGRLFAHRYATWSQFTQFALVGLSGVFVNLGVVTLLLVLGAQATAALAGGILVSIVSNFLLNRSFTFARARATGIFTQFLRFCMASSVAATLQFGVAASLLAVLPELWPQLAALVGVGAGMIVNFLVNRFFVFKQEHPVRSNLPRD
ncbi:MAG: glycosyltransferase family 2 protein [Myxococcota bacterium]